jgi:hypothetical protein
MARIVENEKGFKVLGMSTEEARSLGWGIPEGMVCCFCNDIIKDEVFFIAVLNDTADEKCYKEWLERSYNYPEDRPYEDRVFTRISHLLGL